MGRSALAFADFLAKAGQAYWQMLPVTPVGAGDSPYSSESAFAGNPLFIDLEDLVTRGFLTRDELGQLPHSPRADYVAGREVTKRALDKAFEHASSSSGHAWAPFRAREADWLRDYALYVVLRAHHGGAPWVAWPAPLRDRDADALAAAHMKYAREIERVVFEQWMFDEQWNELRAACAERSVRLIGDVPIFVGHDSSDVWANPRGFLLDAQLRPIEVAGVPPDCFSKTGQRWGNPLYAWRRMRHTGYRWWSRRLRVQTRRFDRIRLDHFIGFDRAWAIPRESETAEKGRWLRGPGEDFFNEIRNDLGELPFIAEDLGLVTRRVRALRVKLGMPGMNVQQFELAQETYSPHRYRRASVAYTGTHDNDTAVGWYRSTLAARGEETERKSRNIAVALTGMPDPISEAALPWAMMRSLAASPAATMIVPIQDPLGLGSEARINVPGQAENNWSWRLTHGACDDVLAAKLRALVTMYGRAT